MTRPEIPFQTAPVPFDPVPFDPVPFDPAPLDPARLGPAWPGSPPHAGPPALALLLLLGALLGSALLAGCGGGGGAAPADPDDGIPPPGGVPPGPDPTATLTVNEIASDGQRYRLLCDFGALTWSREGKAGASAGLVWQGALTRLPDGGPNEYRMDATADLLVLPGVFAASRTQGGMLYAGVRHTDRMPSAIDIDGAYSYVRWGSLDASHGSLHLNADGTYALWHERLDHETADENGTWTADASGEGVFHCFADGDPLTPSYDVAVYPAGPDSLLVLRDIRKPALLLGTRRRIIPSSGGLFSVLEPAFEEPYELRLDPPTFRAPWGDAIYYYNVPWNGFASYLGGEDVDRVLVSASGLLFGAGREAGVDRFWMGVRR